MGGDDLCSIRFDLRPSPFHLGRYAGCGSMFARRADNDVYGRRLN